MVTSCYLGFHPKISKNLLSKRQEAHSSQGGSVQEGKGVHCLSRYIFVNKEKGGTMPNRKVMEARPSLFSERRLRPPRRFL